MNLFPGIRKDQSGPFRRVVTFYLGPLGGKALAEYCRRPAMTASQGLRAILRGAAVPVVAVRVRLEAEPVREPLYDVARRLPDVRRAVTLDDIAWEGLIRTMRTRGVTHQEAMRRLLREAWRQRE